MISIHALREEGDCAWLGCVGRRNHFYPRPPRGGRQEFSLPVCVDVEISIHALREEGDWWRWGQN